LTSAAGSGINIEAAVAATRGDLGQLAPRKKLLKSFSSFPEDFLRPSEHFGAEGFLVSPLPAALIKFHVLDDCRPERSAPLALRMGLRSEGSQLIYRRDLVIWLFRARRCWRFSRNTEN
jgi:hypothetical protein